MFMIVDIGDSAYAFKSENIKCALKEYMDYWDCSDDEISYFNEDYAPSHTVSECVDFINKYCDSCEYISSIYNINQIIYPAP